MTPFGAVLPFKNRDEQVYPTWRAKVLCVVIRMRMIQEYLRSLYKKKGCLNKRQPDL